MPTKEQIESTVEKYLSTFDKSTHAEIAFYGGTFTGLPRTIQEEMLRTVSKYVTTGRVKSIRLSTRPDYIDPKGVSLLKKYGVGTIELGVQSMDDDVLCATRRGYNAECVYRAVDIIQSESIDVGMQMMIGLPGDNREKSEETARRIIKVGAKCTRIYPTLVIRDTVLAHMYERGEYRPLSIAEAVDQAKTLLLLFEEAGVTVLRVGLHPTEDFLRGEGYLAGPFHVSFRELVETAIWKDIFDREIRLAVEKKGISDRLSDVGKEYCIAIKVTPTALNYASGYNAENRGRLSAIFGRVKFLGDDNLEGRDCIIELKK